MSENPFKDENAPSASLEVQTTETASTRSNPPEEMAATLPPPPDRRTEQQQDVVEGKQVAGFDGLEVAYTLQKKQGSMGENVRNDDAAMADPETGLFGVFDGLGGVPNSHLASAMSAHELPNLFNLELREQALEKDEDIIQGLTTRLRIRTDEDVAQIPLEAEEKIQEVESASEAVIQRVSSDIALARKACALLASIDQLGENAEALSVQTTACTGFIHKTAEGKHLAVIANVGDSVALGIRPDGRVRILTNEDSYLNLLLRNGSITRETLLEMKRQPDKFFPMQLPEFSTKVPMKYYDIMVTLTHSIGNGAPNPSLTITELEPNEELILCTDGVVDKFETKPNTKTTPENILETSLDTGELASAYLFEESLVERVDSLRIQASRNKSYKLDDDIAIVAIKIKEDPKP